MKTILYRQIRTIGGMANTYDYLFKYKDCVEEIKTFDFLLPQSHTMFMFEGKPCEIEGKVFDLSTGILHVVIQQP